MRVVSDFREAMWGVLQQGISTLDVDFVAYAGEHFERLLGGRLDAGLRARPPGGRRGRACRTVVELTADVGGTRSKAAVRWPRAAPRIAGRPTGGSTAVPMPARASLERAIGAVLIVVSAAGLVAGGILLGQRADIRLPDGLGDCRSAPPRPRSPATDSPTELRPGPVGPTAVLVGAGDIADCRSKHDDETADLLATIPGIVFTVGDNAYESGSAVEFRRCYDAELGPVPRPDPAGHRQPRRR